MLKRKDSAAPGRVAIDPGAFASRFCCPTNGLLLDEPSVALLDLDAAQTGIKAIRQYGHSAIDSYRKSPAGYRLVQPLQSDSINNFGYSPAMLSSFIHSAVSQGVISHSPVIALTIPCNIDHLHADQLRHACFTAGASRVFQIDNGVATTLGACVETDHSPIAVVIDFGSRGSRIYATVNHEILAATGLFCGGDYLDQQLVDGIRERFGVIISETVAQEAKHRLGCAVADGFRQHLQTSLQLDGLEITTAQQVSIRVSCDTISEILQPSMRQLSVSIQSAVLAFPSTAREHLLQHGLVITGGGALLPQLDQLTMEATGVPVEIAAHPLTSTVQGSAIVLEKIHHAGTCTESA
ncbi:hypothetical protein AB833_14360 [Chromatiales bacterium (ex Bugula neritina AB1)]|nr:hypothetical protein AB833_14360 [Chromatiales bacterium (ex Bugula neritina AB1)]